MASMASCLVTKSARLIRLFLIVMSILYRQAFKSSRKTFVIFIALKATKPESSPACRSFCRKGLQACRSKRLRLVLEQSPDIEFHQDRQRHNERKPCPKSAGQNQ